MTLSLELPQPALPVWRTVWEAHVRTFGRLPALMRIGGPWIAASGTIMGALYFAAARADPPPSGLIDGFLIEILGIFFGVVIATAWHRYQLLAEHPALAMPNRRAVLPYFG